MWPFSDSQYCSRSSWSTVDLLRVVSDRIVRDVHRFGATWAAALDISETFFEKKLKSYGTSGQIVCLFLGSLYQFTQLMLVFLKAPFSGLHLSYYTSMTFLMLLSVILHSMLLLLSTSKSDQASDLWQQLELASELECGHCRLGQDIACWFQSRKN